MYLIVPINYNKWLSHNFNGIERGTEGEKGFSKFQLIIIRGLMSWCIRVKVCANSHRL